MSIFLNPLCLMISSSACIEVRVGRYKQLHESNCLFFFPNVIGNQAASHLFMLHQTWDWFFSLPANANELWQFRDVARVSNDNSTPLTLLCSNCHTNIQGVPKYSACDYECYLWNYPLKFSMKMENLTTFRAKPTSQILHLALPIIISVIFSILIFSLGCSPVSPTAQLIPFPSLTSPVNS